MIDRSRRGFTLIELMIVVAIIAILATIAYPSYVDYVIRSNRSAAQQFILDVAQRQEQYLMDNRRYATALGSGTGELNLTVPTDVASKYTVTLAAPTAITYTITAIPITGTVQASDGTLTLDQAGVKKRVVNGVDKGWK